MDFISKSEINTILGRIKSWISSALGGKVPAIDDGEGTVLAHADGLYDGPNDESYFLPGSDGAVGKPDSHIFAMKGYVDESIQQAIPSFGGVFGILNVTTDTTISDDSIATIIKMGGSGLTITLPETFVQGRTFMICNANSTTASTIATGSNTKRISKIGNSGTPGTSVSLGALKTFLVFATNTSWWEYIELN